MKINHFNTMVVTGEVVFGVTLSVFEIVEGQVAGELYYDGCSVGRGSPSRSSTL